MSGLFYHDVIKAFQDADDVADLNALLGLNRGH